VQDFEPEITVKLYATLYQVVDKLNKNRVTVRVYAEDGLAELDRYHWNGKTGPKRDGHGYRLSDPADMEIWNRNKEVLQWLNECEFTELQRVGPEDSEYFATAKLTGK
jgi:hypothetical protein